MKQRTNSRDSLGYIAITAIANLAGAAAMLLFLYFVSKSNDTDLINRYFIPFSLLFASIAIAATALITGIYFHRQMPDIITPENDASQKDILTAFCRLVLPGEVIRFILCSLPTKPGMMFGYRFFDGFFALVPNYLWDMYYVIPHSRLDSMREFGYTVTDNLVFLAFYLAYLAVILTVYFFLFKRMWKTEETARKNEVKLRMDPSQMNEAYSMNEKQYILERDFYYKREITYADQFKFLGVTLLAHFIAYYYMMCFTSLTQIWGGSSFYIIFQAIGLLPIAWFLPFLFIRQYIRSRVPKLFSLADKPSTWRTKAFRWLSVSELLRVLIGLIPLGVTRFGVMTSPITYLLYTLFYIEPLGKFDAVLMQRRTSFLDIAVFLLIYCAYFFLYDYLMYRKIQKEVLRHQQYLQGCMNEKEKYYNYNERGNT